MRREGGRTVRQRSTGLRPARPYACDSPSPPVPPIGLSAERIHHTSCPGYRPAAPETIQPSDLGTVVVSLPWNLVRHRWQGISEGPEQSQ